MRAVLIVASALALAVALVIAVGGDEEDDAPVVQTTPVTTPEAVPEPAEPTPEKPIEPEPAAPDAPANGGQEASVRCGQIAFEPNTDSGASEIESVGADCTTARDVAREARGASTDLSFETDGFQCTGAQSDQRPITQVEWFCIGPDREVVRFLTS